MALPGLATNEEQRTNHSVAFAANISLSPVHAHTIRTVVACALGLLQAAGFCQRPANTDDTQISSDVIGRL
ncbi:hypothetical protein C2E23DRAFT_799538 [Lenzites betulinus]|nr:hypothetical protein C2E23DRAFT_799538 [Lenzites betulinus]